MRRLSACDGVSGYENHIAQLTADLFTQAGCRVSTDALMNVSAKTGSQSGPVLFVCTPEDTSGLIITDINPNGTLCFDVIGHIDARVLPAMRVRINTAQGPLTGVIGALPPHLTNLNDRKRPYALSELFIDTGLPYEIVMERIQPGMYATPFVPSSALPNQRFVSPFASTRACILVMLFAAELLQTRKIKAQVYFSAAAQSACGKGAGSRPAAYAADPDLAIVISGTHALFPGAFCDRTADPSSVFIGHGPRLHPKLEQRLFAAAQQLNLSCGLNVRSGATATEADWIQITGKGVPTGLIGIPVRFMDTVSETVSLQSVEDAGRLLVSFAESLDEDTEDWLCF